MAAPLLRTFILVVCLAASMATAAPEDPTSRPAGLAPCFTPKSIEVPTETGTIEYKYALFLPKDYDADADRKWPLILFFHGSGECGTDGVKQTRVGLPPYIASHASEFPFITLMPQAHSLWFKGVDEFAAWRMLDAAATELNIDLDRIYITGFSMGGYATWDFIVKRPDVFAAALPICGESTPAFLLNAKRLPIWAVHGAKDKNVPVSGSRNAIESLKTLGADPKYTEYPEAGHNVWDRTYADMAVYNWLLSHKKAPPPTKIEYRLSQRAAHVWWLQLRAEEGVTTPPAVSAEISNGELKVLTNGIAEWLVASADEPLKPGDPIKLNWNSIKVFEGQFPGVIRVTPPQAILPNNIATSQPQATTNAPAIQSTGD